MNRDLWRDAYTDAMLQEQNGCIKAQIRYRGDHNREYPKRSYDIRTGSRTRHFNAEYDDPSMIRNALSFYFLNRIGVPAPRTQFVLLQINDEPPGVYVEIEAVDRAFFESRNLPVRMLAYAEEPDAHLGLYSPETGKRKASLFDGYRLVIGREADRKRWESFIYHVNLLRGTNLEHYLRKHVDVELYLRWLAGAVLTGDEDGFDHNYAVFQNAETGLYAFLPWDYEGTWGRDCYGKKAPVDALRLAGYNHLTKRLMSFPFWRGQYRNLLSELLQSHFREDALLPVIRGMLTRILPDLDGTSVNRWPPRTAPWEMKVMRDYIRKRRKILMEELKTL